MSRWKLLAFTVLAVLMVSLAPTAKAQVSIGVNLGPAPYCPYGYFDYAPYDCAPYGYYGPTGLSAASSSAQAPGSTVHTASSVTWITASIPSRLRRPAAARNDHAFAHSREMRRAMTGPCRNAGHEPATNIAPISRKRASGRVTAREPSCPQIEGSRSTGGPFFAQIQNSCR